MGVLTFTQLWNEVKDSVPNLSPFNAQRFVNRALRDIHGRRNWSHLVENGFLTFPAEVTAGTVSVTQGSQTVTPNAAAIAAWDALGMVVPITQQIFRLAGGPVYRVTAYDGSAATIDKPYQGPTASGQSYQIYRAYAGPPAGDFLRWVSVVDPVSNTPLALHVTREELDRVDPARTESGTPRCLATFKGDSDGGPLFEVHPHLTSAQSLHVTYQRRGADLSGTQVAPAPIPDELILERAQFYACRWAEQNKGAHKEMLKTNWLGAAREHNDEFERILMRAKRQDEETYPQAVVSDSAAFLPSDEYARTHVMRRQAR